MIIVTGPDNCGKTSLVEHLKKRFLLEQVPRYHTMPPVDVADWVQWLKDTLTHPSVDNLIADRFYVEEFVYGPVIRGGVIIGQEDKEQIDKLLLLCQPLIIHCDTSWGNIEKTFGDRKQYPTSEQNKKVKERFGQVLDGYPFMFTYKYKFNYEIDPDYNRITHYVSAYLVARRNSNERK